MTSTPALRMAHPSGTDCRLQTRVVVLDAAEQLFSLHGVDGASVRDITRAAGVNLGAINYHFGSKDRLVMEVFARRLDPVNRERIARLNALEAAAGEGPVELSRIVEAFVRPCIENDSLDEVNGPAFMRLLGRCFMEPHPELKKFVEDQFGELVNRFDAAIMRVLPDLPRNGLFWRMSFFIGTIHHALVVWLNFDAYPHPGKKMGVVRPDREELIRSIITFVTAGMRAPAPAPVVARELTR